MVNTEFENGRFCDICNKLINNGFTNMEGDCICCNECFIPYMNNKYGQNCWRQTEDDGCEGYYEYLITPPGTWAGTGIFWTEWF